MISARSIVSAVKADLRGEGGESARVLWTTEPDVRVPQRRLALNGGFSNAITPFVPRLGVMRPRSVCCAEGSSTSDRGEGEITFVVFILLGDELAFSPNFFDYNTYTFSLSLFLVTKDVNFF